MDGQKRMESTHGDRVDAKCTWDMAEGGPIPATNGTGETQGETAGTTSIPQMLHEQPSVEPETPTSDDLKRDLEHVRTMLASNTLVELVQNFNPRQLAVTASRYTCVHVDHIVPHTTEAQVQHLFSAFGEIDCMEGPQPYIDRYTNTILQRASVDFQDVQSAVLAFNCFYDDDFSAAAHKLPEVQRVTNAKWPKGKLVVLLEEHLPTLPTTAERGQQTAGPLQPSTAESEYVHVEPQHISSGPSLSFAQQQGPVEIYYQQQANARQCITQRAKRRM
ncbi:hypothetical protein COCOBI_08-6170 [Coccomyxa sp. Obi]|nr:hypothetical protein COCOBI_08-6170 [Coccomyxa sp. Obi]